MVTVQLLGGIGNLLFEISTAYALAKAHNTDVILSTYGWTAITGKPPSEYKDTIFSGFEWTDKKLNWTTYTEPTLPRNFKGDIKLRGYWQNPAYFNKYKEELKKLYNIKEYMNLENVSNNIFCVFGDTASLHVRRGDYVTLAHKHPPVTMEYISKALMTLDESVNISRLWVFSDDLEWCRRNIIDDRVHYVDTGDDVTNLGLMSMADHHIISNSTYSWWGAYLSDWERGGITIAPDRWYGDGRTTELNKSFKKL
jgi:hypothetical protein